ncbi:winged helix-turn-helix transcriptional regulator [Amycolatopsis stemonae]
MPARPDERNEWMRDVLARVDDKWGVVILSLLKDGPLRYSALSRLLPGVSQRMVTLSLRKLERDGLIDRTVTPATPPQVEYALTDVGSSLEIKLEELIGWALQHEDHIRRSRARYDAEHPGQ